MRSSFWISFVAVLALGTTAFAGPRPPTTGVVPGFYLYAYAGANFAADEDALVQLLGEFDTNLSIAGLQYTWLQIAGTPVSLSGITTLTPTFIAPDDDLAIDPLQFRLTIDYLSAVENQDITATDTVFVTITGVPEPAAAALLGLSVPILLRRAGRSRV